MIECDAASPARTIAIARQLASALPPPPLVIHLRGELGVGKTLWARAFIQALGGGNVPSPSFALAFSYQLPSLTAHHLDLFRLSPGAVLPEALWEMLDNQALCLIEWPERAADLPHPDLHITLLLAKNETRRLIFNEGSDKGRACLRAFSP